MISRLTQVETLDYVWSRGRMHFQQESRCYERVLFCKPYNLWNRRPGAADDDWHKGFKPSSAGQMVRYALEACVSAAVPVPSNDGSAQAAPCSCSARRRARHYRALAQQSAQQRSFKSALLPNNALGGKALSHKSIWRLSALRCTAPHNNPLRCLQLVKYYLPQLGPLPAPDPAVMRVSFIERLGKRVVRFYLLKQNRDCLGPLNITVIKGVVCWSSLLL